MPDKPKANPVSEAASALAKLRWEGVSPAKRRKAAKKAAAARMDKISPKRRSEIASNAAKSLSPEAAKARALKAWETKRKKAEQQARSA